MKKKNQRQIRKNQLRYDIKQALKHHKGLDRIASGGGTGTDFPIGSNIPCSSTTCFKVFQKEWPRQKYCSAACRRDQVKLDRTRARKAKRARKTGKSGGSRWIILECKRCERSFVREHSRQEYCTICGPIMSTSKGRREYEDETIDRLVEERLIQEGWGEIGESYNADKE